MGSVAELTIAGLVVVWSKNFLNDFVVAPFQEADREEESNVYRARARSVGTRLDLLGHTMVAVRRRYAEQCAQLGDYDRQAWPAELLAESGFDSWLDAFRRCIEAARSHGHEASKRSVDVTARFLLEDEEHFFAFPFADPLDVIRAAAEVAPEDDFVLDLDDLVQGGYLDGPRGIATADTREPVIVVTEGKSDSRLLRRSVSTLFPELAEFLSFIDFETANARGGTDELVQFARMLIGCGIRNRIVFLFDNDTAGSAAHDRLVEPELPDNVFVMKLPDLALGVAYPTLGPEGPVKADINGRACALELYLGLDALTDEKGALFPVRWTGFDDKRKEYQGQITQKGAVQKRFEEKLDRVERDPTERGRLDFSGIDLIVNAILGTVRQR